MRFMVGQKERCSEEEKDAGKEHWQMFVQFKAAIRTTGLLKVFKAPEWWNGAMKGSVKSNIAYCTKDDTRLEASRTWGEVPTIERASTKLALAIAAFKSGHTRMQVARDHAEAYVRHGRNLEHWALVMNTPVAVSKFTLDDFKGHEPITDWSRSWVIWGDSNVGKTCFAKAHFKCPLIVSHVDDFKLFDPLLHDGIVFDDIGFEHWPRTARIHLVDVDEDRSINVKHSTARIPANTKKIFTTNVEGGKIFGEADAAILRRITFYHFVGSCNPNCEGIPVVPEEMRDSGWLPHKRMWGKA